MADLALTTIFQPPASCFDNIYTSLGGGVYEKDVSIKSSECYPSGFRSIFSEAIPYSPGVCPSGYDYDAVTSYGDDATAALCCPLYVVCVVHHYHREALLTLRHQWNDGLRRWIGM